MPVPTSHSSLLNGSNRSENPLAIIFFVMGAPHLYGAIRRKVRQIAQFTVVAGYCARAVAIAALMAGLLDVLAD